jgi:DNA-binding SARP family transcriptional activator/WD40 repeat protein
MAGLQTARTEVAVMRVQLLGPTQVSGADAPLGPRDRVVLGALCVHPGQVLAVEVLATALWGEELPKSWNKIVQGSVMRLRRVLGPSAIETATGGYRVALAKGELDTVEFEHQVARGRTFLGLHEPERAAATFEAALALWRGSPFGELVDWDPARAEADRLVDARRGVEEDLVAAHLAAGRAVDAAAEAGPLVAQEPFRERRWALLATALYRTGRQGEALDVLRRAGTTLRDELGLDPGPELVLLEQRILRQDPALLEVPLRVGRSSATCPYRGLRPFDAADAEFFFGRGVAVAEALRRLGEFPLLLVVGPSGSGKSSLVRAGVQPALERAGHASAIVMPGPDPVACLAAAVATVPQGGALVVDQLEEVLANPSGPASRLFLDRLAELVEGGTRVIATLRSDHLGELSGSPRLARLAERGLMLLTPLSEADLRSAVEEPARLVGMVLEPGLVDLLVRDVRGAPGGLPLLSHALAETWEHREGNVLTVDGYQATGGINSAVANSAERLYDSLSLDDREVVRSVLMRLVTPTPAGEPIAARVPTRIFAGTAEAPRLLDLLVRSRLVTIAQDTATIAHESLVRAWPRLGTWLDEDAEGQRILGHLQVAADSWQSWGRPDEELYRGARLGAAQEWRTRSRPVLSAVEEDFLEASSAHLGDELVRQQQVHAEQVRRTRQLAGALTAAVALLVVSLIVGTQAGLRGRQARQEAARADAAAVEATAARLGATALSESDEALSLLLARQAVDIAAGPITEGALLQSLVDVQGLEVQVVQGTEGPRADHRDHVFTPDGRRLLEFNDWGEVHLLDTSTGRSLRGALAGSDREEWGTFSAGLVDSGRVALVAQVAVAGGSVGDQHRSVSLVPIDAETGEPAGAPQPVPGAVVDGYARHDRLRASPDGRTLVSTLDRKVRVWHRRGARWVGPESLAFPPLPGSLPDQDLSTWVTFSADGSRVAVVMNLQGSRVSVAHRAIWVVDTTRPRLVGPVLTSQEDGTGPWLAAISPSGTSVLVGEVDNGAVRVLEARTHEEEHVIPGESPASALAWSADGRRVAVGRVDGSSEVYSLDPLVRLGRTSGTEEVLALALIGPDRLMRYDIGGTIARFNLSSIAPIARSVPTDRVHGVAVGAGTIAVGGDGGVVQLYDRTTLARVGSALTLGPYLMPDRTVDPTAHRRVSALALLPDGSAVIAADRTGHLRMWSLPDRTLIWSRDDVLSSLLEVAPDGRHLATTGFEPADALPDGVASNASVTIWDLATRSAVYTDDLSDRSVELAAPKPRDIAFSPDSRRLAVSFTGTNQTRVYDVAGRRRTLAIPTAATSLAFSMDGTRLIGIEDKRLWIRDVDTGRPLMVSQVPGLGSATRIRLTVDGRWLVVSRPWSISILDANTLKVAVTDWKLPSGGRTEAFALAPTEDLHVVVGAQHALVDLDLNPERWKAEACSLAARRLTTIEWRLYLPSLRYDPAC